MRLLSACLYPKILLKELTSGCNCLHTQAVVTDYSRTLTTLIVICTYNQEYQHANKTNKGLLHMTILDLMVDSYESV